MPDTDRVFLSAAGGWDRNRDGVVTCDEWKAYAAELFDSVDANRDGMLDRPEYAKLISTDRMFQTVEFGYYDANGDGKVARTEFVDKPNRAFALLDKSNECKLTANQTAGARAHSEQIFNSKKAGVGRSARKEYARHALAPAAAFTPLFGPRTAKLRPLAVPSFLVTPARRPGNSQERPALGAQ